MPDPGPEAQLVNTRAFMEHLLYTQLQVLCGIQTWNTVTTCFMNTDHHGLVVLERPGLHEGIMGSSVPRSTGFQVPFPLAGSHLGT